MDTAELIETIRSSGCFPIQVVVTHSQDADLRFVGSLTDYLAAVKAVKAVAVFVCALDFSESSLIYEGAEDDLEADEYDPVDLRTIEPKLRAYTARIGEIGMHILAAPLPQGCLTYSMIEPWYTEVEDLIESAEEAADESRTNAEDNEEAEADARRAKEIASLQVLIVDSTFQALKTQKAKQEYVLDRFPDLDELSRPELNEEIRNIIARIEAKKAGLQ